MARPTDPAKLAAYLARQAKNSANYRARQKAARQGTQPPKHAQLKQPARYRPPRVTGIVQNAQARAEQQRQARARLISSLPDVRNPRVTIRPGERTARIAPDRKTRAGQKRQAEAISERAESERIQTVGRSRQLQVRGELAANDRLRESMTRAQQADFQAYSNEIASGSQQATAILFDYAGGQGEYSAAIERILASPESRDVEEGLSIMAALASKATQAAKMYAPSVIGRLKI